MGLVLALVSCVLFSFLCFCLLVCIICSKLCPCLSCCRSTLQKVLKSNQHWAIHWTDNHVYCAGCPAALSSLVDQEATAAREDNRLLKTSLHPLLYGGSGYQGYAICNILGICYIVSRKIHFSLAYFPLRWVWLNQFDTVSQLLGAPIWMCQHNWCMSFVIFW